MASDAGAGALNGSGHASSRQGGEVVFFGATDWSNVGRTDAKSGKKGAKGDAGGEAPLLAPHRLSGLSGVSITFVASGCVAYHCMAIDTEGQLYTWGRNEFGQLGHGDVSQRNTPTIVDALRGSRVTWAASGRCHSAVVLDDGRSFTWGQNKHGQLGIGTYKTEMERTPQHVKSLAGVRAVACGGEFTMWLMAPPEGAKDAAPGPRDGDRDAQADVGPQAPANILSAGLPQYGQLGHGTDNQYNAKEGTVKIVFEPQPHPRRIAALAGKEIVKVACGNNHTVAADSKGFLYTWGFGGYGRLGHREQKDEFKPRLVDVFQRNNVLPPTAVVAAGSAFSACTAGGGQLYMWGRVKATGDNWMYPKPLFDLSGWNIREMDCGSSTSCVAADNSCITWGTAQYGELGYGPLGTKSSANPKKVDALENFWTLHVSAGLGHTMAVLSHTKWAGKEADAKEHINKIPLYTPPEDPTPAQTAPAKGAKGAKGKAAGKSAAAATPSPSTKGKPKGARGKGRAAKEEEGEEEEEEDEEEDEDEEEEEDEEEDTRQRKRKGSSKPVGRGKASAPAKKSQRKRK